MSYSVYLVEDHPAIREAFAQLIEREHDLALSGSAASAEEALELGRFHDCDIVVTDVSLPGMNGVEFIEIICRSKPELPVVAISIDAGYRRRAEQAGACRFVDKQRISRELVPTLREVLSTDGRQAVTR